MLRWVLTGGPLPVALIGMGLFYLWYLRGAPLKYPRRLLRALQTPAGKGISPFRAMTLALAGTLGVGNVVGVASAIHIGGAGAIFWMWISALAAMLLKYAEVVLAIRHQRRGENGAPYGGAIYYIRDFYDTRGKWARGRFFSAVFALLMILDALAMGCVIQVNAVSAAFSGVLQIPPWACGVGMLCLLLPALLGGTRGSAALTERLIPLLTLGYLGMTLAVLCLRPASCGEAFLSIFREAFSGESLAGGVVGFLLSRSLRVGTMRGLLSNEAGCGTSPTAHAAAEASSPAVQGVFGIFEVFVDTILLCTATALVILCSYREVGFLGENPVLMSIRAYSTVLGRWSEIFFCIAILAFAYGTVLCWSGYGAECVMALTGRRRRSYPYLCAVLLAVGVGSVWAPAGVWDLSDFAIASLSWINLWMLFVLRREVREETETTFGGTYNKRMKKTMKKRKTE